MKAKHFLIAALALSAFAACSKSATEPENNDGKGNASYLNVQIAYTDATATKATGDDTNPFYYGTADEQAVVSATFFFYDGDGNYMTKVTRSIYEESKENNWEQGDKNVEWIGKGVVILTNVTNKPKYMGVVLNAGDKLIDNLIGKSSTEAEEVISDKFATYDETAAKWTNFVMSSSSYVSGNDKGYYLNTLADTDFKSTEAEALAASSPVQVYVERLATKIELKLSASATGNKFSLGNYTIDGTNTALYAKVEGWGLNATTGSIYCYKTIDPTWTLVFNSKSWLDADNFRSYWGKSTNYDVTTYYPDSYANSTDSRNYDGSKNVLDYASYNGLGVAVGSAAYCRENTNDPASFTDAADLPINYNSTFTSVLLKATLVNDADAAVEVVNYEGQLYTVDGYKTRILAKYKALDEDRYIPWKSTDGTTYSQIGKDDLKTPVDLHDGYTGLEFNEVSGTTKYYEKTVSGYVELTVDEANKMLNEGDKTVSDNKYSNTLAFYYVNGQMYYTVPVEHLNNGAKYNNIDGETVAEGDYGVVRNHYYCVTVNSIKNLGKAVYDPDEEIIPNDKDTQKYFLSAKVNILSWKLVNQTVDL